MKRWLAAGAVAALGIVGGGCGSSALSDSQLHNAATRICTQANHQTAGIATPTSPEETETFLRRGIAALAPELRDLRELRPPSEVADVYDASVKAFAQKIAYMDVAMHDLGHGEDPVIALKTLQHRLQALEPAENGGWRALELPACVSR